MSKKEIKEIIMTELHVLILTNEVKDRMRELWESLLKHK